MTYLLGYNALAGKGKEKQAHQALQKLRGKHVDIEPELSDIKRSAEELEGNGNGKKSQGE